MQCSQLDEASRTVLTRSGICSGSVTDRQSSILVAVRSVRCWPHALLVWVAWWWWCWRLTELDTSKTPDRDLGATVHPATILGTLTNLGCVAAVLRLLDMVSSWCRILCRMIDSPQ